MNKNKITVAILAVTALATVGAFARPGPRGHFGGPHRAPVHHAYHHHHHHGLATAAGIVGLAAGTAAIVHDIVAPAPVVYTQPVVTTPVVTTPVVTTPTVVTPAPVVVTPAPAPVVVY